jgi:sporulation protein YlmC with PRC-barrel domain
MTLISDARGRQVVSTTTAATIGKIDQFVIDPHTQAIVAVTLKKADHGDTLRWSDITAFGADAVTVSRADQLTDTPPDVADLAGKEHHVIGKRVLATTGDELGTVHDVEFDPATGAITALLLGSGKVAASRLIAVGSYAVIVDG